MYTIKLKKPLGNGKCDAKRIQGAVKLLDEFGGGIVELGQGTYTINESIEFKKTSLVLHGERQQKTTLVDMTEESSNGRTPDFESGDLGSNPNSSAKLTRR